MLKFWYRCILLLGLIQEMFPGPKNFEHAVSNNNGTIELNVPVGSQVELLSSIEANKYDTISLYAHHHNEEGTLIAEWKSKERIHMKEQYIGKIYMNDTGGIVMRDVDQADVGRYSFKYDMLKIGIEVMLNVLESTQEKQIPKCLLDEENMKILKGTNTLTIIASIVVMIASSVYIIVHVKSCCSGQCRERSMTRVLSLVPVEGDPSSVTLKWQPPQMPNGLIKEYLVFYTNDSSQDDRKWFVEKVLGDRLSKTIKDLARDTTYCFKVQARYKMGYGPISSTVHFKTPKEQNVPPLAVEETAVQSHTPCLIQQDTDSTPSKLSESIYPLSPRHEVTDPTPTTAEILTEEKVFQYLDSHPEFLIKYLDGKLKRH